MSYFDPHRSLRGLLVIAVFALGMSFLPNQPRAHAQGIGQLSELELAEDRFERVRAKPQKLRLVSSDGSLPSSVPDRFTVGNETFSYTGNMRPRTSLAVPVAVIVAPPYEKVIRSYVIPVDAVGFTGPGQRVLVRPGLRSRNTRDDLIPVSIVPEPVSTTFTQGSDSTSSDSASIEMSFAQTLAGSVGLEIQGIGLSAGMTSGYEAACGTEKGNAQTVRVSMSGALAGTNWTLSTLAKVFAVETSYAEYEFASDRTDMRVTIGVPTEFTAMLFTLDGWNAYAEQMNAPDEILQKLPRFVPNGPWWIGNVDNYPRTPEQCMISSVAGRHDSRPIAVTPQWWKIDRQGNSLSGSIEISRQDWQAATRSFGTNTQYSMDVDLAVISLSSQITAAVKQSYTHQLSREQSFAMSFQTSGVHPLIDGGSDSIGDYHFRLSPVIFRLIAAPDTKAMQRRQTRKQLAVNLARYASRPGTRLPTDLTKTLLRADADEIAVSSNGTVTVAGFPLLDLMHTMDIGADGFSNVLILQYRVSDLGESYGRLTSAAIPLLLAHRSHLLRKVAIAGLTLQVISTGQPGNVQIILGWPPKITLDADRELVWVQRIEQQTRAWIEKPQYRAGQLHKDLTDWLDTRATLSLEASKLNREYPQFKDIIEENTRRIEAAVEHFARLTISPELREQLLRIEPGFYVINPDILNLQRAENSRISPSASFMRDLDHAAIEVRRAIQGTTWEVKASR